MRAILLSSALAMICSLLGTRLAIGWFTRHGYGQPIRDDGPTTHHVKQGTPTMGGLVVLVSAAAAYLVATVLTGSRPSASAWLPSMSSKGKTPAKVRRPPPGSA